MNKVKGVSLKEKDLLVCSIFPEKNGEYMCYVKEGYIRITALERKELMAKPISSEYLLIQVENTFRGTLEEYYNNLINDAEILKKETKGRINMYKSGGYTKTSLKLLFDYMNTNKIYPEPIEEYESKFLLDSGGAYHMAEKYTGPLYKYDSRSFFPSVYSSTNLLIPIKKGILKTLKTEDLNNMKYFDIGVYHCKIESPADKKLRKLIRFNAYNYYSHYELTFFRQKGLTITMIDEPDNFLHYPRDYCKTGSEIFGEFTRLLYKMKNNDTCNGAKKLLNYIWGALTKKNKKIIIHNINDPPLEQDIYESVAIDEENFRVILLREHKFEYDLARMKPFFIGRCRAIMAKTIEPYIDHVHYSHTDSILSSIKLDLVDDGKIGSFRYEGYCEDGFIENMTKRSTNDKFIL